MIVECNQTLDFSEIHDGCTIIDSDLDPDMNINHNSLQSSCKYYDEYSFNDLSDNENSNLNYLSF